MQTYNYGILRPCCVVLIAMVLCSSGCSNRKSGTERNIHANGTAQTPPQSVVGKSNTVYLDGTQSKLWLVSIVSIAHKAIYELGRQGIERVLLLPVTGTAMFSFPDVPQGLINWSYGTPEATKAAIETTYRTQDIPFVENLIEKGFLGGKVPLVSRDNALIKAALEESDISTVFGNREEAARLGKISSADGVCAIKYDFFYSVSMSINETPSIPTNHLGYSFTLKCIDARDGSVVMSETVSTEQVRSSSPTTYGLGNPFYLAYVAFIAPEIAQGLMATHFPFHNWLLAKAWVSTDRRSPRELHNPAQARKFLDEAMTLPGQKDLLLLEYAEISYAMAIGDRDGHAVHLQKLTESMKTGASWWREEALRTVAWPN